MVPNETISTKKIACICIKTCRTDPTLKIIKQFSLSLASFRPFILSVIIASFLLRVKHILESVEICGYSFRFYYNFFFGVFCFYIWLFSSRAWASERASATWTGCDGQNDHIKISLDVRTFFLSFNILGERKRVQWMAITTDLGEFISPCYLRKHHVTVSQTQ